ncbi:hypothetical protein, partial [Leptospira sp. SA-E8]|uniref:hypothetical protein n=1 Tax=Leptospira sp. SA-E8 TaxID=3422259 RepID=UPI003EBCDFF6
MQLVQGKTQHLERTQVSVVFAQGLMAQSHDQGPIAFLYGLVDLGAGWVSALLMRGAHGLRLLDNQTLTCRQFQHLIATLRKPMV